MQSLSVNLISLNTHTLIYQRKVGYDECNPKMVGDHNTCTLGAHIILYLIPLASTPTSVTVTSHPVSPIVAFTGSTITLMCIIELNPTTDVPVIVNTTWRGPKEFIDTNTAQLQADMVNTHTYRSTTTVSSFRKDHPDVYTCTATVSATSPFIVTSSSASGSAIIGIIIQL